MTTDNTSEIPLDINNPHCPADVIHSLVADAIREQYSAVQLPPDPLLAEFLKTQPEGRGYDWEQRVLTELQGKPVELIARWINDGLPRGLMRAELRAYLKQRIYELENQQS